MAVELASRSTAYPMSRLVDQCLSTAEPSAEVVPSTAMVSEQCQAAARWLASCKPTDWQYLALGELDQNITCTRDAFTHAKQLTHMLAIENQNLWVGASHGDTVGSCVSESGSVVEVDNNEMMNRSNFITIITTHLQQQQQRQEIGVRHASHFSIKDTARSVSVSQP
jgi:hypothetical protein